MTVANTPQPAAAPMPPPGQSSPLPTGGNAAVPGRIVGLPPRVTTKPDLKDSTNPDTFLKNMDIPKQLMPTFIGVVKAGMQVVLGDKTHKFFLEEMKQPLPNPQKLANGILSLMILLSHESRGALPPQLFVPCALYLLVKVAAFVNKAGLAQLSPQDISQAMQILVQQIMQKSAQNTNQQQAKAGLMNKAGAPAPGAPPAAPPGPTTPPPTSAGGPPGAAPQPPGMYKGGLVKQVADWLQNKEPAKDDDSAKKTAYHPAEDEVVNPNAHPTVGADKYGNVVQGTTGSDSYNNIDNAVTNMSNGKTATGMAKGGSVAGGQADTVHVRLSHGEYVIDADVVAALGDGNTAAGAAKLKQMVEAVRAHKRSAPPTKVPPKAKDPMAYMKKGK